MSEDLISRADVIDAIGSWLDSGEWRYTNATEYLKKRVKNLPSVQPIRPRGHWIEEDGYDGDTYYDCSVCGESWTTIDGTPWNNGMKYCPNCGADMRETEE